MPSFRYVRQVAQLHDYVETGVTKINSVRELSFSTQKHTSRMLFCRSSIYNTSFSLLFFLAIIISAITILNRPSVLHHWTSRDLDSFQATFTWLSFYNASISNCTDESMPLYLRIHQSCLNPSSQHTLDRNPSFSSRHPINTLSRPRSRKMVFRKCFSQQRPVLSQSYPGAAECS